MFYILEYYVRHFSNLELMILMSDDFDDFVEFDKFGPKIF